MKTFIASLLLLFVLTACGYGQTGCCPYIGPIEILPPNPSTTDTIRIVTHTTTPNQGHEISYSHFWQGNTVYLRGCFYDGFLTAPASYSDTTLLGIVPWGIIAVNYVGTVSNSGTSCAAFDSTIVDTTFMVAVVNAIAEEQSVVDIYSVSPNPVHDDLTIHSQKAEKLNLELSNAWGQVCYKTTLHPGESIDMRAFSVGLYWVSIGGTGQRSVYKVFKN